MKQLIIKDRCQPHQKIKMRPYIDKEYEVYAIDFLGQTIYGEDSSFLTLDYKQLPKLIKWLQEALDRIAQMKEGK